MTKVSILFDLNNKQDEEELYTFYRSADIKDTLDSLLEFLDETLKDNELSYSEISAFEAVRSRLLDNLQEY